MFEPVVTPKESVSCPYETVSKDKDLTIFLEGNLTETKKINDLWTRGEGGRKENEVRRTGVLVRRKGSLGKKRDSYEKRYI